MCPVRNVTYVSGRSINRYAVVARSEKQVNRAGASDLLISLVRAGASGDKAMLRTTVEALAAEERARQHNFLTDELDAENRRRGSSYYLCRAGRRRPTAREANRLSSRARHRSRWR